MTETTPRRRLERCASCGRPPWSAPRVAWTLAWTLILASMLAGGVACGPSREQAPSASEPAADQAPHRGGTLVAGTISDIDSINETISAGSRAANNVIFAMFLHLLDENPDFTEGPPTWDPELAESYSWSDDHLTLTFNLRQDAVWSDGVPVTADDVRFTWQAHTDPAVAWGGSYLKDTIEDVEVVDAHTVRFHFSEVSPYQLNTTVEGVILPKHAWGKLPFDQWRENADFFVDNLVVDGPFTLDRWVPQQEVVLVRNERYHDPERPYLDKVVFRLIPEKSNQVTQLLAGDLGLIDQLPIPDVDRVRDAGTTRIESFWHRLYTYIAWNGQRPLFENAAVRRALTMGIDRQLIVDTIWGPYARVATSPIVQNAWVHNKDIEPWPYDPERAREILADAGWSDTDGDGVLDREGVRFAFDLMTNQGNQERIDAVVMIQEQLARIGIEARPRIVEFNAMSAQIVSRDFDAVFSGWGMPTTLEMRYAFHSSEAAPGGWNVSSYEEPEVDHLIERMESLPSLAEAEPVLLRLQEILHRDQPMTFMWESQRINGMSRRLHDTRPNVLGTFWYLRDWWLAPEGE